MTFLSSQGGAKIDGGSNAKVEVAAASLITNSYTNRDAAGKAADSAELAIHGKFRFSHCYDMAVVGVHTQVGEGSIGGDAKDLRSWQSR